MPVEISVNANTRNIEDAIEQAVVRELKKMFNRMAKGIQRKIGESIVGLIQQTDEYRSLLSGDLLGHLGIPDVDRRLDVILQTIAKGIVVLPKPISMRGSEIDGGLFIGILKDGLQDLLALPEAQYYSNEYLIPWLEWLTIEGNKILVYDYYINFNLHPAQQARSRTGMALMFPAKGRTWRVPPEYSGVEDDNFLTRALESFEKVLNNIIKEEISLYVS